MMVPQCNPPPRTVMLRVELTPAGIFGVDDPPSLVIPSEKRAVDEERLNPDFVFSPKTQSRPESTQVPLKLEWKGLSVERNGNVLELRAIGVNQGGVLLELEQLLRHILENLSLRIGEPIRYRSMIAFDEEGNQLPLATRQTRSICLYDNKLMDSEIQQSVQALELRDETYDQAIYYYQAGCRFRDLWTDLANRRVDFGDSEQGFEETLWACGFLQFWKAITAILEEPVSYGRRKGIFEGRVRALGLPQNIQVMLRQLENIRNDFDVSHRAYDRFSRSSPMRNFEVARHVSSRVLLAYQSRLAKNKPSFGPSLSRVYLLRKQKRSPLRTIAKIPSRRIAYYTIGAKNLNWETGAREVSGAQNTIVTWRFPVGSETKRTSEGFKTRE